MPEFVRDNAGKAFEFMVEKTDEERKAAGLGSIEETFAGEKRARNTKCTLAVMRPICIEVTVCIQIGFAHLRIARRLRHRFMR